MTLPYRDSSYDRPNAAQAAAAFAAGVRVWGGYIAAVVPPGPRSSGGSNLATSWTQADFDVLRAAGIACIGYCSGWDDALACGKLARAWDVFPMLDCEDGIRGDGPWVDTWLLASGAGLYGLCSVHYHAAPAHIVARYPGVPVAAASWDPSCHAPAGLLGWQAEGDHTDPATGLQVDGGWVDDGFALEVGMATLDDINAAVADVRTIVGHLQDFHLRADGMSADGQVFSVLAQRIEDIDTRLMQLATIGGLTPVQAQLLVQVAADIAAVRSQLQKDLAP